MKLAHSLIIILQLHKIKIKNFTTKPNRLNLINLCPICKNNNANWRALSAIVAMTIMMMSFCHPDVTDDDTQGQTNGASVRQELPFMLGGIRVENVIFGL